MKELGLNISEKDYRKLPYISYSKLSEMSRIGPKAVFAKPVDISKEEPIIVGKLVDSYITEGKPPSKYFFVIDKIPSGKMADIIHEALNTKKSNPNILDSSNKELLMKLCNKYDYYKIEDTRIKGIMNYKKYITAMTKYEKYKDELFIVPAGLKKQADEVIKSIKLTFPFFTPENCLSQIKLVGEIDNTKVKAMLDMILVDDVNKKLTPFDLKTGTDPYYNIISTIIKWKYYIQAGLYKELLIQNIKDTKYENYDINDFRFLYCSRLEFLPIICRFTKEWHEKAFNGFMHNGFKKKGIYELLDDYNFYKANPLNCYKREFIGKNSLLEISMPK